MSIVMQWSIGMFIFCSFYFVLTVLHLQTNGSKRKGAVTVVKYRYNISNTIDNVRGWGLLCWVPRMLWEDSSWQSRPTGYCSTPGEEKMLSHAKSKGQSISWWQCCIWPGSEWSGSNEQILANIDPIWPWVSGVKRIVFQFQLPTCYLRLQMLQRTGQRTLVSLLCALDQVLVLTLHRTPSRSDSFSLLGSRRHPIHFLLSNQILLQVGWGLYCFCPRKLGTNQPTSGQKCSNHHASPQWTNAYTVEPACLHPHSIKEKQVIVDQWTDCNQKWYPVTGDQTIQRP